MQNALTFMSWGHINVKYTVAANVWHIKHQISRDLKGWMECAFCILSYNLSTHVMLKLSFYTDTFWRDTQIEFSIQHFWIFKWEMLLIWLQNFATIYLVHWKKSWELFGTVFGWGKFVTLLCFFRIVLLSINYFYRMQVFFQIQIYWK